VTDASSETEGTLVSALRLYSAAKASAEAGRHDVAVETFAEVRIPRRPLISRPTRATYGKAQENASDWLAVALDAD
jgi:hypothetical protein